MEPICAARAMEWSIQLEKGLRSNKPGVPVNAILEIGPRLQQWSRETQSGIASNAMFGLVPGEDALFSNAILLRLADAFRAGDIETRLSVVRVFLSEQKHRDNSKKKQCKGLLSKARVANHLELLKRVKSVFDGGDLESRALALVLFGCWADFAKDDAQIRYLILSGLVSPHDCEMGASLYATRCFCEISDDFASIALEMLFSIMNSSSVSLPVKLTATRVFAKCKSSYSVAHKAYKTGLELVLNSLDEDFIVLMLFSLSKLASVSTLLTSNQVDFLLSFLHRGRTSHVQDTALRCLHFLFRKGLSQHPVNSSLIHGLLSVMEEPEISLAMQCEALKALHKVLLSFPPSSLHAELREFAKVLTIAENAIQYPLLTKSYLAIRILADLCCSCRTADGADIGNGVFCCSSLPLRVISLIKDHIRLLLLPQSEASQNDLMICQDLERLLKVLLTIVQSHPYLGSLVLDSIKVVVESLVTVEPTDLAVPSTHLDVNSKAEKNNSSILKLHKIYRFLVAFLESLYKAGAINSEVLSRVKILVKLVCQCSLIDCYTYTIFHLLFHSRLNYSGLINEDDEMLDYHNLSICSHSDLVKCGFDTPEFVNKVLTGTDGWTAYKVGVHAACQGEWLLAATIFKTLIEKVKSDSCCSWLKALLHYAHSEGVIQLLGYVDETDQRISGHIDNFCYCDKLTASHEALCSSLGILEASVTSSQAFCFQRWYLSLRARVLENVVDMLKALREVSLNIDRNSNQLEAESNGILECLKSYKVISRTSFQLHRLAEEFDLIGRSFIGMDIESSSVLAAHGLSCSILAFAASFGVSDTGRHSHRFFSVDKTYCNLQALTIQNLIRRLWFVDHETKTNLSLLLNYVDQNKCSSEQPRYQTFTIGYKDREVLNVCYYAASGAVHLHDEKTASQVTRNALLLLFSTLIKWMHIRFRIPKYFFKVRQFIGSELFVHNGDSRNGVDISVFRGFHLTLNICVQLKNLPPNLHVKPTKLYCILHCSTSFQVPGGQTLEHAPTGYDAWKDDDIVELNKKLFCHVSDCMADRKGMVMHNTDHRNNRVVEAFLHFEPNEKGQGFSHCVLDVSDFPVGCYRIKWLSCLVDSKGSNWSLLPLNLGPVFVIKPVVG